MKQRICLLIPLIASSVLAMSLSVVKGTTVLSDNFNRTGALVGSSPQIGGAWTGSGPTLNGSTYDSGASGNSWASFSTFTSTLGAGQVITLDYDTVTPVAGTSNVFTGWGGVSLFIGSTEEVFTGNSALGSWGTDGNNATSGAGAFWINPMTAPVQGAANHQQATGDSNVVNHIHFTYNYDSGAYSFSTENVSYSGVAGAGFPFNQLRIGMGAGDVFAIDNLVVDFSPVGVFSFSGQTPAAGSYSASRTNAISVQTTDGVSPVNTNTIVMKLDGSLVSPNITRSNNVTTISYVPVSPLSAGSLHTLLVTLAENSGTTHTNTWSFTTGFPSLPATLPGPFVVSNAVDTTIFTTAGDAWLGTNYQSSSSKTLYVRFSMEFNTTNDVVPLYTWGGLEFYQDSTEKLLVGKDGGSANWSVGAGVPSADVPPVTAMVTNEWHTFVVRVDYSPGGNAAAEVWLDPDFNTTEGNQPNAPLTLSLDNTFNNIRLRCGFNDASAMYSNVVVAATSAGVGFVAPSSPQFQGLVPSANASSAPTNTPVSVNVLFGSYGISTNTVTMTLDGNSVTPTFSDITTNSFTVTYQPPGSFAAGSPHSVMVGLTDSNNTTYSTNWGFTVDPYPALPVVIPGPIDVTGGSAYDDTIWTSQNEWIGNNYNTNSTKTLYTRFSMVFYVFPQTNAADGGSFGGLHFFRDNTERLLVGNAWISTNWSADAKESGEPDLLPVIPIVLNEWHTMVIKSMFASNAPTAETIWLDPDFTTNLENQPQTPLSVSLNNTFNQVRLRCGNGSTWAEFTNIVMAANPQDLGFPASIALGQLTIQNGQLSWTGGGTLQYAPAVTGPWTDSGSQANPQTLYMTNSAQFFRLRQ